MFNIQRQAEQLGAPEVFAQRIPVANGAFLQEVIKAVEKCNPELLILIIPGSDYVTHAIAKQTTDLMLTYGYDYATAIRLAICAENHTALPENLRPSDTNIITTRDYIDPETGEVSLQSGLNPWYQDPDVLSFVKGTGTSNPRDRIKFKRQREAAGIATSQVERGIQLEADLAKALRSIPNWKGNFMYCLLTGDPGIDYVYTDKLRNQLLRLGLTAISKGLFFTSLDEFKKLITDAAHHVQTLEHNLNDFIESYGYLMHQSRTLIALQMSDSQHADLESIYTGEASSTEDGYASLALRQLLARASNESLSSELLSDDEWSTIFLTHLVSSAYFTVHNRTMNALTAAKLAEEQTRALMDSLSAEQKNDIYRISNYKPLPVALKEVVGIDLSPLKET
jgi:hypothetical protein